MKGRSSGTEGMGEGQRGSREGRGDEEAVFIFSSREETEDCHQKFSFYVRVIGAFCFNCLTDFRPAVFSLSISALISSFQG